MYRLLAFALLSTFAFSQATKPAAPAAPPAKKLPAAPGAKAAPAAKPAEVPRSAAVITIDGVCHGKAPANPPPSCKTIVTRADFERLVDALDPNMPPPRRQQLAEVYARLIVMNDIAEQRGIQNSPEAQEVLHFAHMQTLGQLLLRDMEKKAADVPAAEIEKYYNSHPEDFEEAILQRIFLPKTPPGGEKPPDEKTLEAEGQKIHAAAAAGGDFEKLQKQAYDDLGIKTLPPPVSAGTQRRESVPPAQQKVFDLQPGQVSQVINEPGGLYIFKVESKKKLTVADATPEIKRTLESQRLKQALEDMSKNIKPVFNPEYFGPAAAGLPPGHQPIPPTGHRPAPPKLGAPGTPPPGKPPGQ